MCYNSLPAYLFWGYNSPKTYLSRHLIIHRKYFTMTTDQLKSEIKDIQDNCVLIDKDTSMSAWVKHMHISDNHKKIASLRAEIKKLNKTKTKKPYLIGIVKF